MDRKGIGIGNNYARIRPKIAPKVDDEQKQLANLGQTNIYPQHLNHQEDFKKVSIVAPILLDTQGTAQDEVDKQPQATIPGKKQLTLQQQLHVDLILWKEAHKNESWENVANRFGIPRNQAQSIYYKRKELMASIKHGEFYKTERKQTKKPKASIDVKLSSKSQVIKLNVSSCYAPIAPKIAPKIQNDGNYSVQSTQSNVSHQYYLDAEGIMQKASVGHPIFVGPDGKVLQETKDKEPRPHGGKRNRLTVQQKLDILLWKDEHPEDNAAMIARRFDIPSSTVHCIFKQRAKIMESMKHPTFGSLKKLLPETSIKMKKARIKANLPVADHVKQEVEEFQAKRRERERKKGPRTCVRDGRRRITLAEKAEMIKFWEEEKAKDPNLTHQMAGKMLGLNNATLRSMIIIKDEIKRALLIPETADMISIPQEKRLRQMFEDAEVEFPPLPEKEPEPEPDIPLDYEFTISAADISKLITQVLSKSEFDAAAQMHFVMNFRELVETTNKIPVPSGEKFLPKFIQKTSRDVADLDMMDLEDDEIVSCDEDDF
ncbi:Oidioi.mRNA.OKI2018_I69.PAR.g11248.t1.cds [Oikopleura dioica]|uniref:Oidioi.mRNA.OKI2018_I69.PAR.g11248.t1.cds n=1 Tax=Oikopleura dioica TaxID=34765 RepID=A0ABN7S0P8_OIKDI|nr:Oidioi.mRNA.OKI2018_I69.PAR.g11248.t1.cds [Oikopleura dioica]